MYIKELHLENFRNYDHLDIEFDPKINLILGNNAQGKTNILESIYLSSCGKSFRTSKDNEMIGFGANFCRVGVKALKANGKEVKIEIAISKEKKAANVDGIPVKKATDILKNIYVVAFTPEDLRIVKDEPEKRRRFLNREICQLKGSYSTYLSLYRRALHQRNTLLKENHVDQSLLASYDEELVKYGVPLIKERTFFYEKVAKISKSIHEDITGHKESLKITYEPSIPIAGENENQKDLFFNELEMSRDNDIRIHHTTKGPHKDDIKLTIDNVDIRHYGSQGQQRTAALALKLAEVRIIKEETGESPILLLDDVMSELDSERQAYMIESFGDVQLFVTTTDLYDQVKDSFKTGKVFNISKGVAKNKDEAEKTAQTADAEKKKELLEKKLGKLLGDKK
jgi:DNA replication and repair protein RecF